MNQEELKELIISNLNYDTSRSLIERFFDETDGITMENFEELYVKWLNNSNKQ